MRSSFSPSLGLTVDLRAVVMSACIPSLSGPPPNSRTDARPPLAPLAPPSSRTLRPSPTDLTNPILSRLLSEPIRTTLPPLSDS